MEGRAARRNGSRSAVAEGSVMQRTTLLAVFAVFAANYQRTRPRSARKSSVSGG